MKIFQWIVQIQNNSGQLYFPLAEGRYLSGVAANPAGWGYVPHFNGDPVLYPFRIARFQASELRRVGYNVRCVPWLLYQIRRRIQERKSSNPWKK